MTQYDIIQHQDGATALRSARRRDGGAMRAGAMATALHAGPSTCAIQGLRLDLDEEGARLPTALRCPACGGPMRIILVATAEARTNAMIALASRVHEVIRGRARLEEFPVIADLAICQELAGV